MPFWNQVCITVVWQVIAVPLSNTLKEKKRCARPKETAIHIAWCFDHSRAELMSAPPACIAHPEAVWIAEMYLSSRKSSSSIRFWYGLSYFATNFGHRLSDLTQGWPMSSNKAASNEAGRFFSGQELRGSTIWIGLSDFGHLIAEQGKTERLQCAV